MENIYEKLDLNTNLKINIGPLWRSIIKRGIDIAISLIGLLFLWPFFVFIAIKIKQEDPGPAFYRGERVGMRGKIFRILKFRTMYERPESYEGARITGSKDDRITPLGRWLRDTKLNELPQLWNVLVGDMSLVGPRPEDPEIVLGYPVDYRDEILSVRPGITSPASIVYHNEENILLSNDVMGVYLKTILPDKLRLDRLYVRNYGIISDFDTLFWTFTILIPRIGNQKIQEGWLLGGPLTRLIRSYISWFVIDFLIALAVIAGMGLSYRLIKPLDVGAGPAFALAILLSLAFSVSNTILGLKTVSWHRAAASDVFKLFFSSITVATCFISYHLLFSIKPGLPPSFIIAVTVVIMVVSTAARYRMRLLTGFATRWINLRKSSIGVGERALVIGAGNAGEFTTWMLQRHDLRPYFQVVGYLDDDPKKQGMQFDGIKVIGTTADIEDLVERHHVGLLFYAIGNVQPLDQERIISKCKNTRLPMVYVPEILESVKQMFMQNVHIPGPVRQTA